MDIQGFNSERVSIETVEVNIAHAGSGPPLLLLHGFPQTHIMWHTVAPKLTANFHVICADLRGYGDTTKPAGAPDHANYSKRAMAADMVSLMDRLGYQTFSIAGHDRGARVAPRSTIAWRSTILLASRAFASWTLRPRSICSNTLIRHSQPATTIGSS